MLQRHSKTAEDQMSGTADVPVVTTGRTKDGIPTWAGEANTFIQYEEAALLWEQSLTYEKRYTAGPKLVQELTGSARQTGVWAAGRVGGLPRGGDHPDGSSQKGLGKTEDQ